MTEKTSIAIKKIVNDDIESAVFSALDMIDAKKLITKEGMTVLLKPNILSGKSPERAVTTHPEVMRAVIKWLKPFKPSRIIVAESSGGEKPGTTENAMKVTKILDVCEEEGVECVPFEKTEREMFYVNNPIVLKEFSGSVLLNQADLIINLPKIKTHGQCIITCCIKNMFGTVLLGNKAKTHARFSSMNKFGAALADIYSVSNPQLTIVDGYLCQEGNGPAGGDVVKMDLILAGYDPVAIDTTVCNLIGINPEEIHHIKHAYARGLGNMDPKQIEILGESIESQKRQFKKPSIAPISIPLPKWLAEYAGKTIFKADVKFDPEKCKLCATCWKNCPVDAIKPPEELKKGSIPTWNKNKCITCYCCAELCPHEAVNFKINYVKNALLSWFGVGIVGILALIGWLISLAF